MKISLEQVSKRFRRHLIFKDVSYSFTSPCAYSLLGPNGSGKSTLMRIIAGMQSPSSGKIHYENIDGKTIDTNEVYKYTSFCAPGQELVEELTLREFLAFHFSFKKPLANLDVASIIELTGLGSAADKPIYDYSSGMKQRVKLAQAIFSDTPVLLLDEPCTNLDDKGIAQYTDWVRDFTSNRLVIVASNDPREYGFCTERIILEDYQ